MIKRFPQNRFHRYNPNLLKLSELLLFYGFQIVIKIKDTSGSFDKGFWWNLRLLKCICECRQSQFVVPICFLKTLAAKNLIHPCGLAKVVDQVGEVGQSFHRSYICGRS